jgi:mannose-6-phosphate isomerase-like protein (cupin superfamily)
MKIRASVAVWMLFGSIAFFCAGSIVSFSAEPTNAEPAAKVIELDTHGKDYLKLLGGPPESVSMESGLVVLAPQQSVGKHSTGQHEELLVVLEGKGEMIFKNKFSLPVEANHAVYCPPQTEHDVKNTGTSVLRYVYVVADTK